MSGGLLIGVDGGGTYTRAAAATRDGRIVARADGKGINYNNIGLPAARENLREVVEALQRESGLPMETLSVGLSALDATADAETRRRFAGDVFDPDALYLESDAYTALMGATLGGPGLIAICGTGSMLLLVDAQGVQHVRGGWGRVLGDVASSYTIALQGLRAAIDAWEKMGPDTALCRAALDFYHINKPRALIEKVYAPESEPSAIAQFARCVLGLAESDGTARAIVCGNIDRLAKLSLTLLKSHPEAKRVGMYGGVFQHNPWVRALYRTEILRSCPRASVALPEYPPEVGALIHAYHQAGALSDTVLLNLKQTLKEG